MELYDKIHENEELKTYILAGNRVLGELGFTCLLYTSPSPRDCS